MDAVLTAGKEALLNFTSGTILALKPTPLAKALAGFEFALSLYNQKGDILLIIAVLSTKCITLFDHAHRSLGDGWGKEQNVDMTHMDLKGQSLLEVKMAIYDYLTDSEFGRYQILFNGITIAHFEKRFTGPATKIGYWVGTAGGPPSWDVDVYRIDDLVPEERLALVQGRAPLKIPNRDSPAVSVRPPFHSILTQAYASISWDDEKEIRLYYVAPRNVLHEYAYSASKGSNNWYDGNLHTLNIVLDPTSSIAAIRHNDTTCIYYQDPNTNYIRMVYQYRPAKPWKEAPPIVRAVKGSSLAITRDPTDQQVSRVYYQDHKLHLREFCYDVLGTRDTWSFGDFKPGVQRRGTPITAEVVQDGDVDINVAWRDARGRFASGSWSKSTGWDLPNPDSGRKQLDGRD